MLRTKFSLVLMFVLAASSLSCNGGRDAEIARLKAELDAANAAKKDAARLATAPKLWFDTDAQDSIKLLGYDHAYVIRWQHGKLEGWIEFDEEGGPKQQRLDSNSKKREGEEVSGTIVIALQREKEKVDKKADTFQVQMAFSEWFKRPELGSGGGGSSRSTFKVKMEPNPIFCKGGDVMQGGPGHWMSLGKEIVVTRFVGQNEVPWLKLQLVVAPK